MSVDISQIREGDTVHIRAKVKANHGLAASVCVKKYGWVSLSDIVAHEKLEPRIGDRVLDNHSQESTLMAIVEDATNGSMALLRNDKGAYALNKVIYLTRVSTNQAVAS